MEFRKKILIAQNFTLEAAFELLHWEYDDANTPIILAHRLMKNDNIHIHGVSKSGKSHIARLVNLLHGYTVIEVPIESGGNYLKLDGGSDGEIYEFELVSAVTSKDMEVFGRCISSLRALVNAHEHWQALNK